MTFQNNHHRKEKIKRFLMQIGFSFLGIASIIWFLIRVIPKPSRAGYPCMKVATPIASSFVAYLLGILASVAAFKKARKSFEEARYSLMTVFIILAFLAGVWTITQYDSPASAIAIKENHPANQPMGEGLGVIPGRVVWVYDADATNESCTGFKFNDHIINEWDNYWFQDKNNSQPVVDRMVEEAVLKLTDAETNQESWEMIFKKFNERKGKGAVNYTPGEIIFIKTNATSAWGEPGYWGMYETDLSKVESWRPDIAETNPYVVLALLKQLVNEAGVRQEDIFVGDPMKQVYKSFYEMMVAIFPNVNYLGNDVLPNYANVDIVSLGRTPVAMGTGDVIFYSDNQTVMSVESDKLYTIIEDADYMINVPTLKAHARAGITLAAKNHFGSHTRKDAEHLHPGLVSKDGTNDQPERTEYGMYRIQTEIMSHKMLGLNTILVLVDGLYPSDEATTSPEKWNMEPFNGDWASSIFLSMDQVAIESVCFDFLRTEYNGVTVGECRPNWGAVDDYLHQAADSSTWPEGIIYDPDNDGIVYASIGVHEHWNNSTDKQYSRNLGVEEGIELVTVFGPLTNVKQREPTAVRRTFELEQNYPNPFNASTMIRYNIAQDSEVRLEVFNILGESVSTLVHEKQHAGTHTIQWHGTDLSGQGVPSGNYTYKLSVSNGAGMMTDFKQMTFLK